MKAALLDFRYVVATSLSMIACTGITATFAQSDASTPYMAIVGGRISAEAHEDRLEAAKQNKIGNPAVGKEKSKLCQGCHGESGNSTDPDIPKLAGQFDNYIAKQMRNFLSGARTHQLMSPMAATIEDDDLLDIAAYFASQGKMQGKGSSLLNTVGRRLFTDTSLSTMGLACINCHGEGGLGLEQKVSVFPIIGGQNKDYLQRQLHDFRDGNRNNSPNAMMNRMTAQLTDSDIESLADYLASQPENVPRKR